MVFYFPLTSLPRKNSSDKDAYLIGISNLCLSQVEWIPKFKHSVFAEIIIFKENFYTDWSDLFPAVDEVRKGNLKMLYAPDFKLFQVNHFNVKSHTYSDKNWTMFATLLIKEPKHSSLR